MSGSNTLWDFLPFLLMGIPVTIEVTVLAMAVALPVAVLLALGRGSRLAVLRWPAGFVIELFRGSSSLVQLFWAFYVLPFFGINLPALVAGVLVLGLNEGSYFSEVVRAGINAVSAGQREAAVTLGFSPSYRFFQDHPAPGPSGHDPPVRQCAGDDAQIHLAGFARNDPGFVVPR